MRALLAVLLMSLIVTFDLARNEARWLTTLDAHVNAIMWKIGPI
jgi:hypothetical protein